MVFQALPSEAGKNFHSRHNQVALQGNEHIKAAIICDFLPDEW